MDHWEVQVTADRRSDELARCSGTLEVSISSQGEVGAGFRRGGVCSRQLSRHAWPSILFDAE